MTQVKIEKATMLLVLDESGRDDMAWRCDDEAWFFVAAVILEAGVPEQVDLRFAELRTRIGGKEFHFTDDNERRRMEVLHVMASIPFGCHLIACDKRKLNKSKWKKSKSLHHEVCSQLIQSIPIERSAVRLTVRFDTLGGRPANHVHTTHLRRVIRTKINKDTRLNIDPIDSAVFCCGQLTDYVCGAFAYSIKDQSLTGRRFWEVIQDKECGVVHWPK